MKPTIPFFSEDTMTDLFVKAVAVIPKEEVPTFSTRFWEDKLPIRQFELLEKHVKLITRNEIIDSL